MVVLRSPNVRPTMLLNKFSDQSDKHLVAEYIWQTTKVNLYERWAKATSYMDMMRLHDMLLMCVFKARLDGRTGKLVEDMLVISLVLLRKAEDCLLSEKSKEMAAAEDAGQAVSTVSVVPCENNCN